MVYFQNPISEINKTQGLDIVEALWLLNPLSSLQPPVMLTSPHSPEYTEPCFVWQPPFSPD